MRSAFFKRTAPLILALLLTGCSIFHSRPTQQMSYADAAVRAAQAAGAEHTQPVLYQLSRDALLRARSAYRVKDFEEARKLAIQARRIAEDAEAKAISGQAETENVFTEEPGEESDE